MTQIWCQVIQKAFADLRSGGIRDAREAYRFIFSPECESDLKAVCCFAEKNHEVVREMAAKIPVPDKVKGILPKPLTVTVAPVPKEKPCREPFQFGPKMLGQAGYSKLRYYRDLEGQRKRKKEYYAANRDLLRARSKAWKAARKAKAA